MPLYDARLRTPPFLRVFPDTESRDAGLDAIAREVEEEQRDHEDPATFGLLEATRVALSRLGATDTSGDSGAMHALLLFHAYHLRRAGAEHVLASVPVCRWAVEGAGGAEALEGAGFPPAAYVQLPQHLFWVRESEQERPLSLDGFFWTVCGPVLHLLGVMDVQPGEGGMRVLPLPGVPLADREAWMAEAMREGGDDFRSEIPGSELEGLYELHTAGELLKLAARLDRFAALFPGGWEPADVEPSAALEGSPPVRRLVIR